MHKPINSVFDIHHELITDQSLPLCIHPCPHPGTWWYLSPGCWPPSLFLWWHWPRQRQTTVCESLFAMGIKKQMSHILQETEGRLHSPSPALLPAFASCAPGAPASPAGVCPERWTKERAVPLLPAVTKCNEMIKQISRLAVYRQLGQTLTIKWYSFMKQHKIPWCLWLRPESLWWTQHTALPAAAVSACHCSAGASRPSSHSQNFSASGSDPAGPGSVYVSARSCWRLQEDSQLNSVDRVHMWNQPQTLISHFCVFFSSGILNFSRVIIVKLNTMSSYWCLSCAEFLVSLDWLAGRFCSGLPPGVWHPAELFSSPPL